MSELTTPEPVQRVDILGVPCHRATGADVRAAILSAVELPGKCCHIVTLNPEYVMAARRDPRFLAAIERACIIVADGAGVTLACRLIHRQRCERVTGAMISERLAETSAQSGLGCFLLGGRGEVPALAGASLKQQYGAVIAGAWSGGTASPADDATSLARIEESGAALLLVAYGAPGQVLWIDRNLPALERLGVRVAAGVGGTLDVLAGSAPPAPKLLQRAGLEWSWRLWREPKRWRRQLVLPAFAVLVLIERLKAEGNAGVTAKG